MENQDKVVKKSFSKAKYSFTLSREALTAEVTSEDMDLLKSLRYKKGIISHIAVANDAILELAIEVDNLFKVQRQMRKDPMGQGNIAKYSKAIEKAKNALEILKSNKE